MAKCVSCDKKGFFLKLSKDGLCATCYQQEMQKAKAAYEVLASLYSAVESSIGSGDIASMKSCVLACEKFVKISEEIKITDTFQTLFKERAVSRVDYYELPDFNTKTRWNDKLEDIQQTIAVLRETAIIRKKRLKKTIGFLETLEALPRFEVRISPSVAPKGISSAVNDLTFSTVTKKTNREKLGNFVVIDTETTGLSASRAEIVEISAIRFREFEPVECFTTLCKPKKGISEDAADVNGITEEMVLGKPYFGQVVESLQEFIGEDNLVGHNLPFDLKFVVRYGINLGSTKRKYYDTLQIAKHTLKKVKEKWDKEFEMYQPDYESDYDVEDYKLTTLCNYYGIALCGAHRALADCYATGLLLKALAEDRE